MLAKFGAPDFNKSPPGSYPEETSKNSEQFTCAALKFYHFIDTLLICEACQFNAYSNPLKLV